MNATLMMQGLTLMLAGMGTVFVFLTLLVIAMSLMSRLLARAPASAVPDALQAETVAAIAAALEQHRTRRPQ